MPMFVQALLSLALATSPHLDTERFADVKARIDATVAAHGEERVLVVFDIDNTIAATEGDLASEHWFQWQSARIKAQDFGRGTVATSVPDLLRVQGWILNMTRMRATETAVPEAVRELQARGVAVMVLTSRGPEMRDATLRELARSGYRFDATAPGPRGGYGGAYQPFDAADPAAAGLTAADVAAFAPGGPKEVIFERGVMLTQGQHKGAMLRTLLAKTGTGAQFDAIVFVDDRVPHLDGVQAAFAARSERVLTVRYHHESPRIEAFEAGDKAYVTDQWCALSRGLEPVVGEAPRPFLPCD